MLNPLRIKSFMFSKFEEMLCLTPGPGFAPGDRYKGVGTALKTADDFQNNPAVKSEDRRIFSGFFLFSTTIAQHILCKMAYPIWVSKLFLKGFSFSFSSSIGSFGTALILTLLGRNWTNHSQTCNTNLFANSLVFRSPPPQFAKHHSNPALRFLPLPWATLPLVFLTPLFLPKTGPNLPCTSARKERKKK